MDFWQINLIHFLDFYFTFIFIASTLRRVHQYREIVRFIWILPGRWPKLLALVKDHKMVFLTWSTVAPLVISLFLMVLQFIASRFLWPEAGRPPYGLTVERLWHNPVAMVLVVILLIAMLAVDAYFLIRIGEVPRAEMEKHFDQAEYWLNSRTAHVVRIFSLGFVNPRRMVNEEVQKALITASGLLNRSLWWSSLQVGLRFAFGLLLWLTWALGYY